MKVVLTKDVRNVGQAGSVVDVADGHALNFIIPRKLGVPATAIALKHAEVNKARADQQRALDAQLVAETISHLAENPLVITKKANEKGHLYDAVDAKEIAEAAKLPVDAIDLEKPIKELGTFEIPVSEGDTIGTITIRVEAE